MFFFVFEQFKQAVIVPGKGCLPAAALTKDELVAFCLVRRFKTGAVQVDTFFPVFRAAQDHFVSLFQIAVFHHVQSAVIPKDNAGIHTAFFCQRPYPVDLKIFRVHGSTVIVFRRYAV